nr:reverse transcriptase domain-containing protein [Tanacetum cinerariifolium]
MRTRSSSNIPIVSPPNPSTSNPKRRNRKRSKQPFILEESHIYTMADQRTMAELLRAPTEGYAEAIVVPLIHAEQFELKHSLISMMTLDQFLRLEKDNPHDHIRMDRYKDLLRACPHHGFIELHQLDTFYNALNPADQDSLNSDAGGNLLERRTQDVLTIIENKSKCLTIGGNTFLELRDNIQGYIVAVAVNYNQGNFVYRPPGSGSLPSNTIANLKGELKAITTRICIVLDGPFVPIPPPFINLEEDERKMLKALLSNKEKLQELANTPLNENCSAVILKKLPEKLRDLRKFLIPCGFSKLKCKALANLSVSINLMPLSVWKKLGLLELISTRMTLELANRAICTPAGIARDVFVLVGKFTFPTDFVIVDYESDPRVPLILRRPFLWTVRALIDVHGEEMILHDGDERLTLNMRHDTSSYSNQPQKESINLINVFNDSSEFFLENLFSTNQPSGNPTFPSHPEITSPEVKDDIFDPEGGNVLPEKLLDLDSTKDLHPPLHGEKIKESKLLIDELDLPCDFLLPFEYDSFLSEDFSKVDALPSTNNEDKVLNPSIHIQENLFEIITHVAPEKKDKKLAISHASLMIEDFDPPLYELPFFKEVPKSKILLPFLFNNKEKVFKPGIHTSKKVHSSLISELSHQSYKVFKINQILKSPMKIFLFFYGKDTHILDVPCLYFYPP